MIKQEFNKVKTAPLLFRFTFIPFIIKKEQRMVLKK